MLKGRASLSLSMIPADWAVEQGYGQLVRRSYGGSDPGRGFLRWNPGIEEERVIYHFLYGRPAPENRGSYVEGRWTEDPQWTYPRGAGRTRAEQKETALRLTAVGQLVTA
jgi:hypothetical protein